MHPCRLSFIQSFIPQGHCVSDDWKLVAELFGLLIREKDEFSRFPPTHNSKPLCLDERRSMITFSPQDQYSGIGEYESGFRIEVVLSKDLPLKKSSSQFCNTVSLTLITHSSDLERSGTLHPGIGRVWFGVILESQTLVISSFPILDRLSMSLDWHSVFLVLRKLGQIIQVKDSVWFSSSTSMD